MSQKTTSPNYAGSVNRLVHRIHDFYDILDFEGTFKVDDLEGYHTDSNAIRLLADNDAIKQVDKIRPGENRHKRSLINVWKWNESYRKALKEYWDQLDKLPCGHRPNIFNSRKVPEDKLSCRYCAEQGEYPEYSKEFIDSVL